MALTDYSVHAEPSLPTLAAAGDSIVDSVFGETILRLTDADDGSSYCSVIYSNVSSFNCDCTRFFGLRNSGTEQNWFCTFNPETMTRSGGGVIPSAPAGVSGGVRNFAHWHPTNPDLIYMHDDEQLWLYDVAQDDWTLVKDFSATLTGGRLLFQMSMSDDANTFAWHTYSGGSGYLWYARDTDSIIEYNTTENPDEVEVDKSGNWLEISPSGDTNHPKMVKRSDLSRVQATDTISGHRGMGNEYGLWSRGDSDIYRSALSSDLNDASATKVHTLPFFSGDHHYSKTQTNALAANYTIYSHQKATYGTVTLAFEQEIFVFLDDNGADAGVYRLCHHRTQLSGSGPYVAHNFANWSRNGRYIAFNSNWGGDARSDIYIVTVPSALWEDEAPAAPSNPRLSLEMFPR
jgi:hypothetical protein